MKTINKVTLLGYVGQSPTILKTKNGESIVNFSVATNIRYTDKVTQQTTTQTEWHRCCAFKNLGDIISKLIKKGSKVYLEGKLKTTSYLKDNVTHYSTQIICNEISVLDDKKSDNQSNDYAQVNGNIKSASEKSVKESSFDFNDDIPF